MIFSVPSRRSAVSSKSPATTIRMSGRTLASEPWLAHPFDESPRIGEGIVAEGERHALGAGVELLDIGAPAQRLDLTPSSPQSSRSPASSPARPSSRSFSSSKSPPTTIRMSGRTRAMRALRVHPFHQPRRVGERIVAEGERQALGAGVELFDMRAAAERLDAHELQQQVDFRRRRAEAVDDLGAHRLDLRLLLQRGQAAVEREPRRQIGDVALGDRHRRAQRNRRRPQLLRRLLLARSSAARPRPAPSADRVRSRPP